MGYMMIVLFLALSPFVLMPALLAFASKHDARHVILVLNLVYWLGTLGLAAVGLFIGAVFALLLWLGLFVWAIRGVGGKPKAGVTPASD
jgi:hypothetical protein